MSTESSSQSETKPRSRHRLAKERFGDRLREWWFPHRPFEKGGTIYEKIGIRWFYEKSAAFAGEPILPKLNDGPTEMSRDAIVEFRYRARYHEWANIILFGSYVPGLVAGLMIPNLAFFLCHVLISSVNLTCILNERYKRAICNQLLENGKMGERPIPSVKVPEKPMADWYFVPKFWESPKLYYNIGVEFFRLIIVDGVTGCRYPPHERVTDAKFMENLGMDDVLGLEATTRVSEFIHLCAFLGRLFLAFCFWGMEFATDLYFVLFGILDLYFVLLQRYHRTRVWKLVQRYRTRKAKREPGATPKGSLG